MDIISVTSGTAIHLPHNSIIFFIIINMARIKQPPNRLTGGKAPWKQVEFCQGCGKVLPQGDHPDVCFSCKHHKFCEECEIDNLDMCPACEKRFCQKCLDVCSSCKHKFCEECEDMCPFCEERFCQKCDDLSGIGCRQCQDAALKFGFM